MSWAKQISGEVMLIWTRLVRWIIEQNQHWNSESIYTKWNSCYSCHNWTLIFDENVTSINGYT
jgi:hypothetical protein